MPWPLRIDGQRPAIAATAPYLIPTSPRRSTPQSPTFDVALEFDRTATLTTPLLPGCGLDIGALFALD